MTTSDDDDTQDRKQEVLHSERLFHVTVGDDSQNHTEGFAVKV